MALIIDGYNLLNATDITGHCGTGSSLARTRLALLDFLADRLATTDRRTTVVVFDGRHAPPGLEPVVVHREITVRFARPNREADDVIEELIRENTSPKRLTVVSSDHRLHRAARRRRAVPIDSELWFQQFARRPVLPRESASVPSDTTDMDVEIDRQELEHWLREFGGESPAPEKPQESLDPPQQPPTDSDLGNPFPPGYGEDLLRGEAS
ncbi:MAG: hypothetical protein EA424_24675 [Planctomycetaceae bacterium]|nr:MAG: hypothetical protein EA424_24675 [Planctomycetaceae bacterium]